jgi:hypothetical protein
MQVNSFLLSFFPLYYQQLSQPNKISSSRRPAKSHLQAQAAFMALSMGVEELVAVSEYKRKQH